MTNKFSIGNTQSTFFCDTDPNTSRQFLLFIGTDIKRHGGGPDQIVHLYGGVAVCFFFFSVFVSFRLLKVTVIGNDGSFSNNLKWLRPGARFPVIGIWYGCMRRLVTWRNWLQVRLRTCWSGGLKKCNEIVADWAMKQQVFNGIGYSCMTFQMWFTVAWFFG